jgi:hypothetical protein
MKYFSLNLFRKNHVEIYLILRPFLKKMLMVSSYPGFKYANLHNSNHHILNEKTELLSFYMFELKLDHFDKRFGRT